MNVRMQGGGLELVHGRKLGRRGVTHANGTVIVPQRKDTSHGNIDAATCLFIHILGIQEHIYDAAVYGNGAVLTIHKLVDGTEILQSVKAVVDGKEAVVFFQLCENRIGEAK